MLFNFTESMLVEKVYYASIYLVITFILMASAYTRLIVVDTFSFLYKDTLRLFI